MRADRTQHLVPTFDLTATMILSRSAVLMNGLGLFVVVGEEAVHRGGQQAMVLG